MKKIFITLFISVLALGSASAQNEFKLGVEAGAGVSLHQGQDNKARPSFSLGLIGEYHLSEDWMLDASLKLCSRHDRNESRADYIQYDYISTSTPYYLELPVLVAKKYKVSDCATFFVGAGPMIGYGLGGNYKYTWTQPIDGKLTTQEGTEKYFDRNNRFEHGFSAKVGLDISNNYRVSVGYNMMNHGSTSSNNSHNLSLNFGYIF